MNALVALFHSFLGDMSLWAQVDTAKLQSGVRSNPLDSHLGPSGTCMNTTFFFSRVDSIAAVVTLLNAEARAPLIFTYAFFIRFLIYGLSPPSFFYDFSSEDSTIDYSGVAFNVLYDVFGTTILCVAQ
jgi:hypothetical protein